MAGIGGVVVQFRADADKAIRETKKFVRTLNDVDGASKKVGKGLSKMAKVGIGAVAAGAATAGYALWNMVEGAVADDAAQRRLARSMKNTAKATDAEVAAMEEWITAQGRAYGVTDDQLRPALARLVRSTKDVQKAQELAALGMDISAASGKDMETVANALAKANDGNLNALKRLGITLGENANNAQEYNKKDIALAKAKQGLLDMEAAGYGKNSKEYQKAAASIAEKQAELNGIAKLGIDWQGELAKAYQGSAEEQAASVEGAMQRIKTAIGQAGESVGAALLPSLQELAAWLSSPEGTKAIEDFARTTEDFSRWLATDLPKEFAAASEALTGPGSFYENLMQIQDLLADITNAAFKFTHGGKTSDEIEAEKEALRRKAVRDRAEATASLVPKGTGSDPRGKRVSGGGQVIVNITNGKQEKSIDSAAMAIRVAKAMG